MKRIINPILLTLLTSISCYAVDDWFSLSEEIEKFSRYQYEEEGDDNRKDNISSHFNKDKEFNNSISYFEDLNINSYTHIDWGFDNNIFKGSHVLLQNRFFDKQDQFYSINSDINLQIDEDLNRRHLEKIYNGFDFLSHLGIDRIHQEGSRGFGTKILVIDDYLDLKNPLFKNGGEVKIIDNPKAQYTKDEGSNIIYEYVQHGTHVTGIIKSIVPEATIYFIPVGDQRLQSKVSLEERAKSFYYALNLAKQHDVDVINISYSNIHKDLKVMDLSDLIEQGKIIFLSAGNYYMELSGQYSKEIIESVNQINSYFCRSAGRICLVGNSLDTDLSKEEVLNSESDRCTIPCEDFICAPGSNIFSSIPLGAIKVGDTHHYRLMTGTSMATPMVTGSWGLLKSMRSNLPSKNHLKLLYDTAKKSHNHPFLGQGILDVGAAYEQLRREQQEETPVILTEQVSRLLRWSKVKSI